MSLCDLKLSRVISPYEYKPKKVDYAYVTPNSSVTRWNETSWDYQSCKCKKPNPLHMLLRRSYFLLFWDRKMIQYSTQRQYKDSWLKTLSQASISLQDAGFLCICSALEKYTWEGYLLGDGGWYVSWGAPQRPSFVKSWRSQSQIKGNWLSRRATVWLQHWAETSHKLLFSFLCPFWTFAFPVYPFKHMFLSSCNTAFALTFCCQECKNALSKTLLKLRQDILQFGI